MENRMIIDEPDKNVGLHEDLDQLLEISGKVKYSLLTISFELSSWKNVIKNIIIWGGSPLITPICILLSKLMGKPIDLFIVQ